MSSKSKYRFSTLLLVLLLLGLTIGYAYLNTTLDISGTSSIKDASWNVYWDNVQVTSGSVTGDLVEQAPTIDINKTTVSYSITLEKPGDFYEFTVDAKNDGSIDAMIDTISSKMNNVEITTLPSYLNYSVTYSDGVTIEENQLLSANTKETYKVRVEYKKDVTSQQLPTTDQNLNLQFSVTYKQANNNAIAISHSLEEGNYVYLQPDSATYLISPDDTGYSSDQVINPSELVLWKIINKNPDGKIEMISEYTSSVQVYFYGVTGYAKYISTLQKIADQYQKEGYTESARIMGYDGQTPIIEDTYYFDGSTTSSPARFETPSITTGEGEEYRGGLLGDTLYLKDYQLVSNAYIKDNINNKYGSNGLKAYRNGTTTYSSYYISSRHYWDANGQSFDFRIRFIHYYTGFLDTGYVRRYSRETREWSPERQSCNIRPIIVLKPNIKTNGGTGTIDNPYTLKIDT